MPYGGALKDERPTSNIERPTSNVEWEKMKKQTYDLKERLLEYSVRIIKIVECSVLGVCFLFDVGTI